jgi:hypothetical protein
MLSPSLTSAVSNLGWTESLTPAGVDLAPITVPVHSTMPVNMAQASGGVADTVPLASVRKHGKYADDGGQTGAVS